MKAHTLLNKSRSTKILKGAVMKILLKLGLIGFAFGFIFIGADTVNAQNRQNRREARREYRDEVRDARQDRRRDIRNGTSRREANREFRDERRDARREYRSETGRRINRSYNNRRYNNRGYNVSGNRRVYSQQRTRVIYRNGRRYVVRY